MGIHARFRQLINRWYGRLFAADDAVALARGSQISHPPKGFSPVYRDPQWDLISECKLCRGGVRTIAKSCPSCGGTATDVVHQAWLAAVETDLTGRTDRIVVMPGEPRSSEEALRVEQQIGSIGPTRARCLARLRRELATVRSRLKDTEDAEGGSPEGGRTGSYLLDDLLDKAEHTLREKFEPSVTTLGNDSSQSTGDAQLDDLLQRADAVLRSYLAEGTQRTEAELCAPGIGSRPRRERSTTRLTPQELRVALVVADGATNVEAAAQLFLSTKTIEFHLSNIYRKLGIRSRDQLARSVFGTISTPLGGGEARGGESLTAG